MRPVLTILLLGLASAAAASDLPTQVSTAAEALARFDGSAEVKLLNVWATWCVPCVAEMDLLEQLNRTFGRQGLEIVGISVDDLIPGDRMGRRRAVARFLDAKAVTFANVYYTGKANDLADELDFDGSLPITILYNRNGDEIERINGAFEMKDLESKLRELLGGLD